MTYYRRRFLIVTTALALAAFSAVGVVRAGPGFWTPVGPEGGIVASLAIDPNDTGVLYAGVLKSADGGATWQQRNNGLTNQRIFDFAVDPAAPDTVYAATFGGGVFKTTDGANSWSLASTGLTEGDVRAVVVHPFTSTVLYAGTDSGIFKSSDGAASWPRLARSRRCRGARGAGFG
jgi:hypothetical protein